MTLDTILTVAIGRNGPDGTPLPYEFWQDFQEHVREFLGTFGTIVAMAETTEAVGSDGLNEGESEDSAIFVVVGAPGVTPEPWRAGLATILRQYEQTSACFAVDRAHEPVWSTPDGSRPVERPQYSYNEPTELAAQAEARRRHPAGGLSELAAIDRQISTTMDLADALGEGHGRRTQKGPQ